MFINLLFVLLGIVVLVKSADLLVESSSELATRLGISAVVVGAIVVGFGTSMPEMAVSTTAAVRGDISLGIGNVVGSIIANLTLVLGATTFAALVPLSKDFLKFHIPLSMNAVFWFFVFIQNGLQRYEGFILLGLLVISLILMVNDGKRSKSNNSYSKENQQLEFGDSGLTTRKQSVAISVAASAASRLCRKPAGPADGMQLLEVDSVEEAADILGEFSVQDVNLTEAEWGQHADEVGLFG